MSTLSERASDMLRAGYWAVQIRLDAAAGIGNRFLCHASDARAASAMAARLMGTALPVRGYEISRIDEPLLESQGVVLPSLGESVSVRDPVEWARLLAAHELSEPPHPPAAAPQ